MKSLTNSQPACRTKRRTRGEGSVYTHGRLVGRVCVPQRQKKYPFTSKVQRQAIAKRDAWLKQRDAGL
jgi:hypothetical protein